VVRRLSEDVDDLGRVIRLLAREELRRYLERMEALERISSGGRPPPGGRKKFWGVLVAFVLVLAGVSVLGPLYFLGTSMMMAGAVVSWTLWQIARSAPEERRPDISEWFRSRFFPRHRRFRNALFLIGGLLLLLHHVLEILLLRFSPGLYESEAMSQTFHYWIAFIVPSATGFVAGYRARGAKLGVAAGICAYIVVSLGIAQPLYRYGGPWITANWEVPGPGIVVPSPSLPYVSPALLLTFCAIGGLAFRLSNPKEVMLSKKAAMVGLLAAGTTVGLFAVIWWVQPPVEWHRKFSDGYLDPVDLVWSGNSGVIASSIHRSITDIDVLIVRFDALGNTLWKRTYGGPGLDMPKSMGECENGWVVAGTKTSLDGQVSRTMVLRINTKGEVVWNRTYRVGDRDLVESIISAEGGGFILAGSTVSGEYPYSHPLLLKIDDEGEAIWNRSYREVEARLLSVVEIDRDLVAAGYISGDIYVLKADPDGEVIWEKTYDGYGWGRGYSITGCIDSGLLVAAETRPPESGSSDIYLLRIDGEGALIWNRTYGGIFDDHPKCIIRGDEGSYLLTGYTWNLLTGGDMSIMEIDEEGQIIWEAAYGGLGFQMANAAARCENGYLIVGRKGGGMLLLKTPDS
jgi:hypothetical protein